MTEGGARSFEDDIQGQAENLRRAADTFLPALQSADLSPFIDGRLVITGMGASYFAAMPAAMALRVEGRPALAVPATELLDPGGSLLGGPIVGISQSGRSAETVQALRASPGPRLALTNSGGGQLAEGAESALPIGSEADSGISVLTYTAALFAAASLASRMAEREAGLPPERLAELIADVLDQGTALATRLAERFADARAVDFMGRGFSAPSPGYGALLVREAARLPASWFDTRQYLHGPLEAAEAGIGAVLFGDGREVVLAQDLAGYGATVLLVTTEDVPPAESLEVFTIPALPGELRPILEAVPAQLLAGAMARARGLSPGMFRREQDDTKLGPT